MSHHLYRSAVLVGLMLIAVAPFVPSAAGAWLDIDPLTFNTIPGRFDGTLGSVPVQGIFDPFIALGDPPHSGPGGQHGESTVDNSSPQFSYASVFSPTIPFTDRVGYNKGPGQPSRITLNFNSPVTNPVFHIANLDRTTLNFAATPGLLGMTLLGTNAGIGDDGLALTGTTLRDINQSTVIGQSTDSAPPTAGPRSAYGSVLLRGTFSQLLIDSTSNQIGGDGGHFTISTVPEPATMLMVLAAMSGLAAVRRRAGLRKST